MSDKYMTFQEALEVEEGIYKQLQQRKEAARQAEADYWNVFNEPADYEELKEQRDRYAQCLLEIIEARLLSGGTSTFRVFVDDILERYIPLDEQHDWFKQFHSIDNI